jgi:hypothetical protein
MMLRLLITATSIKQQVALAAKAGYQGLGNISGVLGLAFPSITQGFAGNDPSLDRPETQVPYNPVFTSMYKAGLIPPVFSLAISRSRPIAQKFGLPEGFLALGGLAPVITYGQWARSPIQYVQIGGGYVNGSLPYPQYRKFPRRHSLSLIIHHITDD